MRFGEITLCSLSLSIPNQPSNQPKPGVQHCLPEINQSQEGLSSDFCYVIFSHLKSEFKKKITMEMFTGAVWLKLTVLHYSWLESWSRASCHDVESKLFLTFNTEILWPDFFFFFYSHPLFIHSDCLATHCSFFWTSFCLTYLSTIFIELQINAVMLPFPPAFCCFT